MSQLLVQTTVKHLLERYTILANNLNEGVVVSSVVNVGDTIIRIEPSLIEFDSNRVLWFYKYPFYVTSLVMVGDTEINIEPASYSINEGSIVYPNSHVSINDWSILDSTWLEAPYLIIENAFRVQSSRTGHFMETWTIPIQPHIAWSFQDIALAKLTQLIDEITDMFESKLLYPKLPAIKFTGITIEAEPYFRTHPNVPSDIPGNPMYAGQRVHLSFEDYESTYSNFDVVGFFNQFT